MATASRVGPGSSDGSVQGAGTRERILDATARVLSERGYAGTKLSAIAEYAEIQAPAIRERQAQEESRLALVWRDLFQAADEAGFLRRDLDLTIMRLNVVNSLNITAEWWTPRLGTLGELVSTTQEMVRSSVTPR